MTTVAYTSPFVPPEWIAAHGLNPLWIRPAASIRGAREGACPLALGLLERPAPSGSATILTATCDQLRRASELLPQPNVFLMHVPATWETVSAQRLYQHELQRLGAFLVRCGGRAPEPSSLQECCRRYDEARNTLRELQPRLSGRAFADALHDLHQNGCCSAKPGATRQTGVRVALVGGPLLDDDLELYDLLEAHGARLVLDGTEHGERSMPAPLHEARLREDPLAELATAYFGAIPDVFRRPNSELYRWLKREFAARDVEAVLVVYNLWCDLWHAEVARLKEWAAVPVAELALGTGAGNRGRTLTRIEALIESAVAARGPR